MGTIDKILNLLKMNKIEKSYSVKFYAEMKLDDGTCNCNRGRSIYDWL